MSESRDKEDLIGKMLLKAGLVDEGQLENVRKIQSTLLDRGASVSSLSILHQNELVSRADLEKLQEFVDERFQQIDSILPPALRYSFLKEEPLARRALEAGVVSRETFDRARKAKKVLDEYGIDKTTTELLVEQESVDVQKLRGLHSKETGEDAPLDAGADTASFEETESGEGSSAAASTSAETTRDAYSNRESGSVMTSVDRNLLEELVRQDRIERSQIPDIVNRARTKQQQGDPASSPVRSVLKEMSLITPENAGDLIDAAMENQARRERWDRRSLLQMGAVLASVLLLITLTGFLFSTLTGTDGTDPRADASTAKTKTSSGTDGVTADQNSPRKNTGGTKPATADASGSEPETSPPERTSYLMTFKKQFNFFHPEHASCTCQVEYDGRRITERNLNISPDGRLSFSFARSSERNAFSKGLYLARCTVREDTPRMPQDPLNALEMYGPDSKQFQGYIYEEQWSFRIVERIGSLSSIVNNRWSFAEQLRTATGRLLDVWAQFQNGAEQSPPNFQKLNKQYSNLNRQCSSIRKQLEEINRTYRTHPYPDVRSQLEHVTRQLPRVALGIVKKRMEQEGRTIPENLKKRAGAASDTPGERADELVEQLKNQRKTLPEKKNGVQLSRNLRKYFEQDVDTLLQNETLLRLLSRKNVLREGLPTSDALMMRSTLTQIYKYVSSHIEFHALLVENAGALRLLSEKNADKVRQLPPLLTRHLHALLARLAEQRDVDLPFKLKSVDRPIPEIRKQINQIARTAGVSYTPFSDEGNRNQ